LQICIFVGFGQLVIRSLMMIDVTTFDKKNKERRGAHFSFLQKNKAKFCLQRLVTTTIMIPSSMVAIDPKVLMQKFLRPISQEILL